MKKIHISQVDAIFANGCYPIEFLFYFQEGLSSANIRSALKKLSSDFWPVFGQYESGIIRSDDRSEDQYFLEVPDRRHQEFNKGWSHEEIHRQHSGINPSKIQNLFFLSLIHYQNGTALIPKMNHLSGDGYSYFYFLTALAALSRGSSIPFKQSLMKQMLKPSHDRTKLRDFQLRAQPPPIPKTKAKIAVEIESISRDTIRNKIKSIAAEYEQHVSSNDLLSAFVVKKLYSYQRQKGYSGGNYQLTIPIDVRRQIKEYGFKFFGNGLFLNTIDFAGEDIEHSSAASLAYKIREFMPSITKNSYFTYLEKLETLIATEQWEDLRPFNPARGCLVTNLSKMPGNKLNFGTGPPDLIIPLTLEYNSAAVLAEKDQYHLRLAYLK